MRNNRFIIRQEVMARLKNGERLRQCDLLMKTWRLAAYVHDIQKRSGWCVSTRKINRWGAVEYYLSTKELARISRD